MLSLSGCACVRDPLEFHVETCSLFLGPRRARFAPTPSCCASPTSTAIRSSSPMPATSGRRRRPAATATRLTAHPGLEVFAKFSPDGKWIAFTGQYDGDEQVYVMPAAGGAPRQLTYYPARGPFPPRWGYDNQVYGWSNDGKRVLFRSLRDGWFPGFSRLYQVSMEGGPPSRCRCPSRARARSRRAATRWSTRRAPAISARRSATAADRRTSSTSSTSRPTPRRRSAKASAPAATPCGSATPSTYDSDRDGHFNLYALRHEERRRPRSSRPARSGTSAGRARDRQSRIVYELHGGLEIFDVKSRKTHADLDHGAGRRPRPPARARQRGEPGGDRRRSAPRASACCSARAATSSPRRSRRGRCAT